MQRVIGYFAVMTAIFLTGSILALWSYNIQKDDLLQEASHDLDQARRVISFELNMIFEPAPLLYGTLVDAGLVGEKDDVLPERFFDLVTGSIRNLEQLNGAFIGFPDGRFFHVQDLLLNEDAKPLGRRELPVNRVVRRVIDSPKTNQTGQWFHQQSGSREWSPFEMAAKPYDPRSRGWYKLALDHKFGVWTDPYTFSSSGKNGITFARPIYHRSGELWAVMGVDLSLEALSKTLTRTGNALAQLGDVIFATDVSNRILAQPKFLHHASSATMNLPEAALQRHLEQGLLSKVATGNEASTVSIDGNNYLVSRILLVPSTAMPIQVYLARNTDTVLKTASEGLYRNVILIFASSVIVGLILFYAAKLRLEVSARKEAEEQLVAARDTAEAATRAKSTFLATMSHEIRTPMNGVMSMAELLTTTPLDSEQRRMSGVIYDSANALLTIINDILDFSKIEAGKLDIEAVELSLMEVVDGAAELLAPKVEEKDVVLLVDIDTGLADIRIGDPVRLRQILLNLGSNAVKFTESGQVTLHVYAPDQDTTRIRFEVEDTGIGLNEDQLSNLFQPFTQAESSTTRKYGGTGLGLSICKRLVEMMDGEIGAESIKSKGSTFWFELPLKPVSPTAPSYDGDLSALGVSLVGLTPVQEKLAVNYLQAGGISDIKSVTELSDLPSPNGRRHLVLIDSKTAFEPNRLPSGTNITVGLVGPRNLLHDLPADLANLNPQRILLPLSRTKLWHAAAIATGLVDPDQVETSNRTDLDFSPPDYGTAADHCALILVAEDNPTNQTVIRKMLDRMGFACEIHDDGQEALAAYRPHEHGLILTDINMPRMSGYELTLAVRDQEADSNHHVPIFALTADALSGTERDCLEAGMDGYLTKPIDSRKLGKLIAEKLPAALPLRTAREAQVQGSSPEYHPANQLPADQTATDTDLIVDWDQEIFNPSAAIEIFGALDGEAHEFITGASDSWDDRIETLETALNAGDLKQARAEAHALKGAALSIGAERMGRIAGDIQDALDAGDPDMAGIMAPLLAPTLTELRALLPHVFAKIVEK